MSLGNETLTFVIITDGPFDRLGIATKVRTEIPVFGWHFRPLNAEEVVGLTDIATEVWKGTGPPDPVVLAAEAIDEVKHNGITYQIIGGVKPYKDDLSNEVFKVTVLCQKQTG